jgi:hypothetical protein
VADEILRKIAGVVKKADPVQLRALDSFPVAI